MSTVVRNGQRHRRPDNRPSLITTLVRGACERKSIIVTSIVLQQQSSLMRQWHNVLDSTPCVQSLIIRADWRIFDLTMSMLAKTASNEQPLHGGRD